MQYQWPFRLPRKSKGTLPYAVSRGGDDCQGEVDLLTPTEAPDRLHQCGVLPPPHYLGRVEPVVVGLVPASRLLSPLLLLLLLPAAPEDDGAAPTAANNAENQVKLAPSPAFN